MSDELEPLGPLALRALAAERRRGDVDAAIQQRLLARVVVSVAVGAAATAAVGGVDASAGTGSAAAGKAGLTIKTLPWIVAAFVTGGAAGAAIHAAVAPASPMPPAPAPTATAVATNTVPSAAVSASSSILSIPVTSLPSAQRLAVPAPRANASASASSGSAAGGSDVDLADERALVDRARTALGRGKTSDALDALDAHATRFSSGRLSEEREALTVDALAHAGRMDEARARAARFRASYPNSVFGAVVDVAVAPR